MATKEEDERRRKLKEKGFLDHCSEGDLESVKALLAEDPSLINNEDEDGKFQM